MNVVSNSLAYNKQPEVFFGDELVQKILSWTSEVEQVGLFKNSTYSNSLVNLF